MVGKGQDVRSLAVAVLILEADGFVGHRASRHRISRLSVGAGHQGMPEMPVGKPR